MCNPISFGLVEARLTMEERNNPHESRIQNVRRKLFQDDDDNNDGEGDNFVNRLLEEDQREKELSKQRWNFDFKKGEPLPGPYEWVKLDRYGNEIPDSAILNKENPREEETQEAESNASESNETKDNEATRSKCDDKK